MTKPGIALILLTVFVARAGAADERAGRIGNLFASRAAIRVEQPGIARVALTPDVLAGCAPDLGDLRILDGNGKEVAYLLDHGIPPGSRVETEERPRIINVSRGEELRDGASPLYRESYEIDAPRARETADATWQLVFRTNRAKFVRRVEIRDGAGPDAAVVVAESIFRLPLGGDGAGDKTTLDLPPIRADRLTVTLEGDDGSFLEPSFAYTTARELAVDGRLAVPLVAAASRAADGRTIVELARPRGLVPDVLRFETTTPWFDREVRVLDRRAGAPDVVIGARRIVRMAGVATVESSDVPVRPATGDVIVVEITDGDSPPLEALVVRATMRQPSLLFAAGRPIGESDGWFLYFGGGRVGPPHYDVAALIPRRGESGSGEQAAIVAGLRGPGGVVPASLGAVGPNPAFDRSPLLAFAMRPGAAIDTRLYTHRRPLAVPASLEGLTRVALGPEDVARARDDLSDVRIVDTGSRQWPYLLERDSRTETVALTVRAPVRDRTRTSYALVGPATPLRLDGLAIDVEQPFVDRPFRLLAKSGDAAAAEERVVAEGRIVRRSGESGAFRVAFRAARVESLRLVVDDGNEAPLALRTVAAQVPLPELYLTAPEGAYFLLVGNSADTAPSYELARVRDAVLAVSSAALPAGPLDANPAYSAHARPLDRGRLEQAFFWVVLVLTVAILGTVTLRLARREGTSGS
jgi:hypothetical protein